MINYAKDVTDLFMCPKTGTSMHFVKGNHVSDGDPSISFPVEDGIIRAFLAHDEAATDVTVTLQHFYSENPFPNYDEMETIGSLIEKSMARRFPEMLNCSIAPGATVLEVGCGTGQLGNFLSIANRRVLSVDMTWNSLLLGQRFKERCGLNGVTFAQMNLFHLPLRPGCFDVVICSGVLHHTSAPVDGFNRLVPLVKPGGHIVIGLYNRYGRLRTRFRKALVSVVGERAVAQQDPYLRHHSVGGDKRRAWFMDQYRNPHESLHTMDEVLGWFDASDIRFVRAVPSTLFGTDPNLDYRRPLFKPEDRGSWLDRLISQIQQMVEDQEGGLFVMIGRRL